MALITLVLGGGVLNEEGHHSSDQSVTPNSELSIQPPKWETASTGQSFGSCEVDKITLSGFYFQPAVNTA